MLWIFILVFGVQAKHLDGHVNITDGVFVYTDVEWNTDVLGVNGLKNMGETKQSVIGNEATIKYDITNPTNEQKLTMMYVDMLEKARKEKIDLNLLLPTFVETTNPLVAGDEKLVAKRNELLAQTTYKHENNTYIMVKQKFFDYTDNTLGKSKPLENGKYLINTIDPNSPKTFYLFFLVNAKGAIDCLEKSYDLTFDSNGFGLDKDTKNILKYDEISSSLEIVYNVIDNSKEYIDAQLAINQQHQDNVAQAGSNYSGGGNWDLENSIDKSNVANAKKTNTIQPSTTGYEKYNIDTINLEPSTKAGRGVNSVYYNGRNTLTNHKNMKYINLAEDPYNLSYGVYEVEKATIDNKDHILFERAYGKSPTEMNVKTENSSYILINFQLNKKDYINSQVQVYKDGVLYQDLTIDSLKKDILLDVSDCSSVKFTVKPISKQIDLDENAFKKNIVLEPGKVVQNGVYSKNYVENNQDAANYYEYNDMKLYADMYMIF
jgi:hypothetical protein